MKQLTIEELQQNFDQVMNSVENGETFLIKSENGNVMLVPYGEYKEDDDFMRIYTNHEEGS
jgi:antitoxin (DNA-binding transcriptional repressor) of toxin-antitoxin stability system